MIPTLSLTHSPVSETLPVPELRLLLFSISFHARAQRFRTTSTCLRPWWSLDDSNLPCFSMLSLRRVTSVRRFSSQLCHGPRTTNLAHRAAYLWEPLGPDLSEERGTRQRSCMREMIHRAVKMRLAYFPIRGGPTKSIQVEIKCYATIRNEWYE